MSASADPTALAAFAAGTREPDLAVATAARRADLALLDLAGSLPHGLVVDPGPVAAAAAHAVTAAQLADTVGRIGAAFAAADRGGFIGPVAPRVVHGEDPVLGPEPAQGLSAAAVSLALNLSSQLTTAVGVAAPGASTAHARLLVLDSEARAARTAAQNAYRLAAGTERAALLAERSVARVAAHGTRDLLRGNAARPFSGLPSLDRAVSVGPLRVTALGTGAAVLTASSVLASGGSSGDATVAVGMSVASTAIAQSAVTATVGYLATSGVFLVPGAGQVALTAVAVIAVGYGLNELAGTEVGQAVTGAVADAVDSSLDAVGDLASGAGGLASDAWNSVFG